jgi:hypothetical protein
MTLPRFQKIRLLTLRFMVLAALIALLTADASATSEKKARPPKPEDLVGVRVGFDSDELTFTCLDLRPDLTGFCARVSPPDTILHDNGVQGYRVTRWTLDEWKVVIQLTPTDRKTESIYLKGSVTSFSLRLEIGGSNGKWKQGLLLWPESRIQGSDRETKDKIDKLEKN